jgi:hypothetical protein
MTGRQTEPTADRRGVDRASAAAVAVTLAVDAAVMLWMLALATTT